MWKTEEQKPRLSISKAKTFKGLTQSDNTSISESFYDTVLYCHWVHTYMQHHKSGSSFKMLHTLYMIGPWWSYHLTHGIACNWLST